MLADGPIVTPRLTLRPLADADVGARYLAWMNDPLVQRHLESRFASHAADDLLAFVRRCNASPDSLLLGLFTAEDGHVGNIKLGPIDPHHGRGSIGIMLGERSAWGKGYGREAIAATCAHAFARLGLRKATAGCYAGNAGAIAAFERAGFRREGLLLAHAMQDGDPVDVVMLGLQARDAAA